MKLDIKKVKIFVTVPIKDTDSIRNVVCNAGAGIIGNYKYCTTTIKSLGTFMPNEQANPYIGNNNKLEFVEENKLEFVCNVENVKNIIKKIREVHPYEEPAIDIVPLIDEQAFNEL